MRRYAVQHVTTYTYDGPVTTSFGRTHLVPRPGPDQQVTNVEILVAPEPAELREHTDYFGNRSTYFCVREEHHELQVTARSEVRVDRSRPDAEKLAAAPWEDERAALDAVPTLTEYRLTSPRVALDTDLRRYARDVIRPGVSLETVIEDLLTAVARDFTYRSGVTTVDTSVAELLDRRAGVCQHFAHLAVACLRSVGLAARYVSGYLETFPPPGVPKLQGADASHAWASVYSPTLGWVDFDPTNNQLVDDRYIVVATGRDYGDVPPLKGVIMTSAASSELTVGVDVTPID
ncbi:MAG: transglutaminase family protein [bacterium]